MNLLVQRNQELLGRIKEARERMRELCTSADAEFGAPDRFYRFYYQSFKVFHIQVLTKSFYDLIVDLSRGEPLNPWFVEIVEDGLGKQFELGHNEDWLKYTRPLLEAYFHARMAVDQMLWCADNMEGAEAMLPSPWAAVLAIFKQR